MNTTYLRIPKTIAYLGGSFVWLILVAHASATTLVAKNGMFLEGKLGYIATLIVDSMAKKPPEAEALKQIVLLDDGLRRTYLSWLQVQEGSLADSDPTKGERIRIPQHVANGRQRVVAVTSILEVGPFDRWGRRTFSLLTPLGPLEITQGITEITPVYTRLEGLAGTPAVQWDCRIATSSLPRETISQVLRTHTPGEGAEGTLQVVRLLLSAERYNDARVELEQAMSEFPELKEFQDLLAQLREFSAKRIVEEIEFRQKAGQHQLVRSLLATFPDEGVGAETLQRVSELSREYDQLDEQKKTLDRDLATWLADVKDPATKSLFDEFRAELDQRLNPNSWQKLADYLRLRDDAKISAEGRLSLLLSGWVVGAGKGTQNMTEAQSLVRVRAGIAAYLRSTEERDREAILQKLGQEEGGSPQRILDVLHEMVPYLPTPPQPDRAPGHYVLEVPGIRSGETFQYEVQLPNEYDEQRVYPVIVALHGEGTEPGSQLDWWAGPYHAKQKMRLGQATRHGYIVIAPRWLKESQAKYGYSGQEHAVVLSCLRDAMRRFSVDTDRVFLSGHYVGGDAAWDIGLAHPDLWAGVILISALSNYGPTAPKYVTRYESHARYVPLYIVQGELDAGKMAANANEFDHYLKRSQRDVMIVEYQGRGREHFFDEIHRLFTWMDLHHRDPAIREFEVGTMRTFDNFFWYLELNGFSERTMVDPLAWPAPATARPSVNRFTVTANGQILVKTGAESARLWLLPGLVDERQRVTITVNGRARPFTITPQVETILRDVRTRGDRLHPFWATLELTKGRG